MGESNLKGMLIDRFKRLYIEEEIRRLISSFSGTPPAVCAGALDDLLNDFIAANQAYFSDLENHIEEFKKDIYGDTNPVGRETREEKEIIKFFESLDKLWYWQKIEDLEGVFRRLKSNSQNRLYAARVLGPDYEGFVGIFEKMLFRGGREETIEAFFDFNLTELQDEEYSLKLPFFSGISSSTFIVEDKEKNQYILKVPHPCIRRKTSTIHKVVEFRSLDQMIEAEYELVSSIPPHESVLKYIKLLPVKVNGRPTKGALTEAVKNSKSLTSFFSWKYSSRAYAPPIAKTDLLRLALIGSKVAGGLKHINSHNIVHKDLGSDNILVQIEKLDGKIIDFGFSERIGQESWILGNRSITPPTSVSAAKYDLWSLGAVLYYMLTGIEDIFPRFSAVCSKGFHKVNYDAPVDYTAIPPLFRNIVRNLTQRTNQFDHDGVIAGLNLIRQKLDKDFYPGRGEPAQVFSAYKGRKKLEITSSGPFVSLTLNSVPIGYVYKDEYLNSLRNLETTGKADLEFKSKGKLKLVLMQRDNPFWSVDKYFDTLRYTTESPKDVSNIPLEVLGGYDTLVTNLPPYFDYGANETDFYLDSINNLKKIREKYPLLEIIVYTTATLRGREGMVIRTKTNSAGVDKIVERAGDFEWEFHQMFQNPDAIWSLHPHLYAHLELAGKSNIHILLRDAHGKSLFNHKVGADVKALYIPDKLQILLE